jgi:hypothetical protein
MGARVSGFRVNYPMNEVAGIAVFALTVAAGLATGGNGYAQLQRKTADLPSGLIAAIQNEPIVKRCGGFGGAALGKTATTTWLELKRNQAPASLFEGLPPCLAGNDNGTKLIFVRSNDVWRKVLECIGDAVEVIQTSTNGWHDLVLWQHDNASRSARQLLRFDGNRYKSVSCNLVQFQDEITRKKLAKPRYEPCTEEFLEMGPV